MDTHNYNDDDEIIVGEINLITLAESVQEMDWDEREALSVLFTVLSEEGSIDLLNYTILMDVLNI